MRSLSRLTAAVVGLAVLVSPARAQEKAKFDNLMQALRASGALNGKAGPQDVNWINGGRRFSFTIRGDSGEQIRAFDPASGADTLLFSAQGHTFPGSQEPFTYRSFQWSQDSRYLVFQSHFKPLYRRSGTGDFYVYSVADGSMEKAASEARTAELSPDGKTLGYERGGDMFVFDLAGKKETRLTSDATDSVFNGHFDWVYEEEFGMAQAWNWSPDSRYIAYWQLDERPEPVSQFTDYAGQHPDWDRIPVPLVGDSNAKVRIGVVNVKTGSKQWLDTGENQDTYIPRIYWTSQQDTLAVVTLNRLQNTMKLFFFDVNTGGRRLVMGDSSKTWIDIYDFYAGIQDMLTFPANSHEFFWISDRDGWQHVYRYDYSGKLIKQVTSGKWSVTRVEGIDSKAKKIYYTSTEASPLQRQLYVVGFDGRGEKRLTTEQGTHSIDMSPNTQYYIDRWSSTTQPRQVELWATGHKMLKKLEDNAQVTEWIKTHAYSPAELFSFTTSDGVKLDGSLVKPTDFDSARRYPMIFAVYGGPGSQQVYDRFETNGWAQWLAQHGYLVVGLNNRGSNNYGSAFEKIVYQHLGKWEANDFAEAARWLGRQPYGDSTKVAITGTSYGGYATVYTMEAFPDLFKVGAANSAVTDWRLYDDIYTERYMGLPSTNAAGYDSSSAVLKAPALTGHLLLIHSMLDDNVHPANTMQLLTAMANAGHDVDLRIYPPGHHGAAYNLPSIMLIQQNEFGWFEKYLK